MRALRLFVVSAFLLLAGFGVLASRFNGSANLTFGWPPQACAVKISGAAAGGLAFAAFLCVLLGAALTIIALVAGLISLFGVRGQKASAAVQ